MRRLVSLIMLIAAVTAASNALTPPASTHITLNRDAEPLKSTFNADSGTTRILMLVAPT